MPGFRKAVLLYNPAAGTLRRSPKLIAKVETAVRGLADSVTLEPTRGTGTAGGQARAAVDGGCDLVIAFGGDGTVFETLQGMARTSAAMAVLPGGTANVLANDIGLANDPVIAAGQLKTFEAESIPLGRLACGGLTRWFSVAAGVGVHSELVYNASAQAKQHGRIGAYYVAGFDLLFRHGFVPFEVEITRTDGAVVRDTVLEMVAMRVSSFGWWLRRWKPGSDLRAPHLQLVLLKESGRMAMMRYVFEAMAGRAHREDMTSRSADVRFVPATRVRCTRPEDADARQVRVQADGEVLGGMPAEFEIVPGALRLLMPAGRG
ncbi:MAG TPA: diacylglycerol kinase family protein [Clostridia bacterium]|nr:diacylglycerol kinase family protein [Clostridia bacterium]